MFIVVFANQVYANWLTYNDAVCGYKIQYPNDAKLTQPNPKIQDLYFPPAVLIEGHVKDKCTTKISLPIQPNTNLDGKYVYIFALNNFPNKLLENSEKVRIGNKLFYKVEHSEAGMCHYSNYYYYFFQQNRKYYALLILFASHCAGVVDNQIGFDLLTESQNFSRILSSFELI